MKNKLRRLPSIPLEDGLMDRVDDRCREGGATKTAIVTKALEFYLDNTAILNAEFVKDSKVNRYFGVGKSVVLEPHNPQPEADER